MKRFPLNELKNGVASFIPNQLLDIFHSNSGSKLTIVEQSGLCYGSVYRLSLPLPTRSYLPTSNRLHSC